MRSMDYRRWTHEDFVQHFSPRYAVGADTPDVSSLPASTQAELSAESSDSAVQGRYVDTINMVIDIANGKQPTEKQLVGAMGTAMTLAAVASGASAGTAALAGAAVVVGMGALIGIAAGMNWIFEKLGWAATAGPGCCFDGARGTDRDAIMRAYAAGEEAEKLFGKDPSKVATAVVMAAGGWKDPTQVLQNATAAAYAAKARGGSLTAAAAATIIGSCFPADATDPRWQKENPFPVPPANDFDRFMAPIIAKAFEQSDNCGNNYALTVDMFAELVKIWNQHHAGPAMFLAENKSFEHWGAPPMSLVQTLMNTWGENGILPSVTVPPGVYMPGGGISSIGSAAAAAASTSNGFIVNVGPLLEHLPPPPAGITQFHGTTISTMTPSTPTTTKPSAAPVVAAGGALALLMMLRK